MANYKKTLKLNPTDAAYIAGIIDGEGTISLSRKHKSDNRQLVISISNTERQLLEYIFQAVGTGKLTRKKTSQEKHTPSFTYSITNRQALDLLEQIKPYLKTYKSSRAELVLSDYIRLTPRNGKYSETIFREREIFIDEFFSIKP
jgi:hypothetical protein